MQDLCCSCRFWPQRLCARAQPLPLVADVGLSPQTQPPRPEPAPISLCSSTLFCPNLCAPPLHSSPPPPQYDDPVLLAGDVEKREGTVRRVCEPILSKPPPPPPKKAEPAPAAEAAPEAEMADAEEVGPQPPAAEDGEPTVEEPMEA
ncbi:hypothetical protein ABPG75_008091 [Micractinium tetrahymenae]